MDQKCVEQDKSVALINVSEKSSSPHLNRKSGIDFDSVRLVTQTFNNGFYLHEVQA